MPNISQNGGAFVTGNLHVGALNGFGLYQALLTQSSTTAPIATVLYSNLSDTLVWSYSDVGSYLATLTGEFMANKTGVLITGDSAHTGVIVTANAISTNQIAVKTWDTTGTPALANAKLTGAYIEIIIAP